MNVVTFRDVTHIASTIEGELFGKSTISSQIATVDEGWIDSASTTRIQADCSLHNVKETSLIIVPAIIGSRLTMDTEETEKLAEWLSVKFSEGVPILALSTGIHLLGKSGLLNHRTIATHWAFVPFFRETYPDVTFSTQSSFIESGGIYTTGSLMGGLEALLYQFEMYRGDKFAGLCSAYSLIASPERITPILPGRRDHNDVNMLDLQGWIEEHYEDPLSIGEMARGFGLSETSLKRKFKKATGLSPIQYLQEVRVEKAKKLLLSTGMSIQEITHAVGYENTSFFIRLFKRLTGVTPAQYRSHSNLDLGR